MTRAKPDLADLEARVGHAFTDRELLTRALTHISAAPASRLKRDSYQRLEFLGDRVLGLIVADMLMAAFPDAPEGELSRRLAELVRRESCTDVATQWGVGAYLRIGGGEAAAGVRRNAAILADVCESIVGAAYLDAGLPAAREVVERAFGPRLHAPRRPLRDAKTQLQEWAQARGKPAPTYRTVERSGPDHAPRFVIEVDVEAVERARGEGASKRDAEQAAARAMMQREGIVTEQVDA
ncbi:ribonuclease III [Terrarubrum flagellatum]|uniref:ribonuclease III n=1 Tax=Terrirubrum flagellatum TaxID=2895980 RepID=UPI00314553DF